LDSTLNRYSAAMNEPLPDASGAEFDALGIRRRDELGEIVNGIAGMDDDRFGGRADDRRWPDVVRRVAHVPVERAVDRHRGGGDQDRVAVGGGLGDRAGAEIAAGAALVLDHHVLAEPRPELFPDGARDAVGKSAGRGGDDDGDRLRRIRLLGRRRRGNERRKRGDRRRDDEHNSTCHGEPFP
jgi:hypothetical protein